MSLYIEKKYADIISIHLPRCRLIRRSPYTLNFRCIICGDSQKNKYKKRGYIYEDNNALKYKCHNCGEQLLFSNFMKDHFPNVYHEFRLESIKEWKSAQKKSTEDTDVFLKVPKIDFKKTSKIKGLDYLKNIKKVSQLKTQHYALNYLNSRKIPHNQHWRIYHCREFLKYINDIIPNKIPESAMAHDEPRLCFPLRFFDGTVYGVIGRSYKNNSNLRYLTIIFDKEYPKIFGLDTIDITQENVYVVEGPIDSLFIPNAIAMAGTDANISRYIDKEKCVIILDNQPRNKEVVAKYEKYIRDGYRIVIWPNDIKDKDINDMILSDLTQSQILKIINSNTFCGIRAELAFNNWKKI